jgi:mono/diheme cytochrome c family protein
MSRDVPCVGLRWFAYLVAAVWCPTSTAAEPKGATQFHKQIEPILSQFCFECHGNGSKRGGVAFDQFQSESALLENRDVWWRALKMLRAGIMPPKNKPRPSPEQIDQIARWIKTSVFQINPKDPDPGRVTVHRLNRIEYRNTIRDLMGVQFNTDVEFPADDAGHGFDNIGDVLSMSPLLLEKYIAAARTIVAQAVPMAPTVVATQRIPGQRFRSEAGGVADKTGDGPLNLSYYKPATGSSAFQAKHSGHYRLLLDLTANEKYVDGVFDYNKCRLVFNADGKKLHDQDFTRQGGKPFHFEFDQEWKAGEHELTFEIQPLTPNEKQTRSLVLRIVSVTVCGPLEKEFWVPPANYQRFFPKAIPESLSERRKCARELLQTFATRAFRRPVNDETVDRLVKLAETVYTAKGRTFEAGIAQAMTVVLASPRFLFREEGIISSPSSSHPLIDEYSLASRLSYFLWSSMPDDELFQMAGEGKLRANLKGQVGRMLADPRAAEFTRNFTGQWLQARDIETVEINARAVILRDEPRDPNVEKQRARFRELFRKPPDSLTDDEKKELEKMRAAFGASFRRFAQFELNRDLRVAMRRETEMVFEHILRDNRSLLELIDSDYTFLNERLAKHYGIDGVKGDEMRLVKLPPDSPRSGVLTQGTMLATTSNPDRTSPVKRGVFILDNILGTPPPPPPPNIPALEDAVAGLKGPPPTLRETLKLHRSATLCGSCHNRMDPLGLAFENFNALGRWREKDRNQPIDAAGQLITGESYKSIREFKRILATDHRRDFYRCLTEKMLTYALGRGLDYYDVQAVDEVVEGIEKNDGHFSALLSGIVESAPFQKCRAMKGDEAALEPGQKGAEQGAIHASQPK